MWIKLLIGVGGMVFLATLFVGFQELANRRRMLGGECRMDSVRCLGCLATGRCRGREQAAGQAPDESGRRLHSTPHTR